MMESFGSLDKVKLEDDSLVLEGWSASRGGGPVDAFKVAVRGWELPLINAELGRPSLDVKAVHPTLDHIDACRFRLRCGLDAERRRIIETSAICATPFFRGEPGKIEIHLMTPTIPQPSAEDIAAIGGGFLNVSTDFLRYYLQLVDLKPDESVLDVGCGVGRMAYMLAHYMRPEGRYEGFDIMGRLIDWASAEITPRYPNFHFQKVNVHNTHYNPEGEHHAAEFRFPYEDESFDFIFLTSVFTHMFDQEVRHYLDEFNRVLRPGGRCFVTCFLLNDESRELIRQGKSSQNLVHPLGESFISTPDFPEVAVGFDEALLLEWIRERGFEIQRKLPGYWCERSEFLSYQDTLIFHKVAAVRRDAETAAPRRTIHRPNLFRRAIRKARRFVRS